MQSQKVFWGPGSMIDSQQCVCRHCGFLNSSLPEGISLKWTDYPLNQQKNLQFYFFLLATSKTLYQSLKGLRLLQSCNLLVIGSWTTRKLLQTSEIYKYSITRAEITFPSGRRRERERERHGFESEST